MNRFKGMVKIQTTIDSNFFFRSPHTFVYNYVRKIDITSINKSMEKDSSFITVKNYQGLFTRPIIYFTDSQFKNFLREYNNT